MATKRKTAKATTRKRTSSGPSQALTQLQTRMKGLQKDAEALLRRTQKQTSSLITKDQRKALDRLLSHATRLRDDLDKRADRATKDLEARAERFLSTLEKEASKRLTPLLRRLDLPSRQELQTLNRRLARLEKKVTSQTPAAGSETTAGDDPGR